MRFRLARGQHAVDSSRYRRSGRQGWSIVNTLPALARKGRECTKEGVYQKKVSGPSCGFRGQAGCIEVRRRRLGSAERPMQDGHHGWIGFTFDMRTDVGTEVFAVVRDLGTGGLRMRNWSAETFPVALDRFEFLHRFEGVVVSGIEKTRKPFPYIYQLTLDRFNFKAEGRRPTALSRMEIYMVYI